jgi:hypothetical protein
MQIGLFLRKSLEKKEKNHRFARYLSPLNSGVFGVKTHIMNMILGGIMVNLACKILINNN